VILLPYRVVLDSNFFFLPLTLRIDIFTEIEDLLSGRVQFMVIKPVKEEVERLSRRGSSIGKSSQFAKRLMEKCRVIDMEVKPSEKVDDAIVRFSKGSNVIVATSDMLLKKKLRDINVPVIYVRDYSRLELEGFPVKDGNLD
jgi:rRNA-processing protein FCF1